MLALSGGIVANVDGMLAPVGGIVVKTSRAAAGVRRVLANVCGVAAETGSMVADVGWPDADVRRPLANVDRVFAQVGRVVVVGNDGFLATRWFCWAVLSNLHAGCRQGDWRRGLHRVF